jgi:hypothetical protein
VAEKRAGYDWQQMLHQRDQLVVQLLAAKKEQPQIPVISSSLPSTLIRCAIALPPRRVPRKMWRSLSGQLAGRPTGIGRITDRVAEAEFMFRWSAPARCPEHRAATGDPVPLCHHTCHRPSSRGQRQPETESVAIGVG